MSTNTTEDDSSSNESNAFEHDNVEDMEFVNSFLSRFITSFDDKKTPSEAVLSNYYPFKDIPIFLLPQIENVKQSVIICAPSIDFAKLLFADLYTTLDMIISRGITISIVLGHVDDETRLKCSERDCIKVMHTTIPFFRSTIKVDNTLFAVNHFHGTEIKDCMVWMLTPDDDGFDCYNDELNIYFQ